MLLHTTILLLFAINNTLHYKSMRTLEGKRKNRKDREEREEVAKHGQGQQLPNPLTFTSGHTASSLSKGNAGEPSLPKLSEFSF